ncbi:MAG: hypothetical protein WCJ64_23390, partial [Rhodospirillaceae bacterium]
TASTLARNPAIPPEIIDLLAASPDSGVRQNLADNSAISAAIRERLARDPEHPVRRAVASSLHTPKELLIQLAKDSEEGKEVTVRQAARRNPNFPADADLSDFPPYESQVWRSPCDFHHTLHHGNRQSLTDMAGRADCPRDVLIALAKIRDPLVDTHIVSPCISKHRLDIEDAELLTLLAASPDKTTRSYVAKNKHTPWAVVETMIHDRDPEVAAIVAEHPNIPYPYVALAKSAGAELFHAFGTDGVTPALVSLGVEEVRTLLAKNTTTPDEVLVWLSHDLSKAVRKAVAENENSRATTLGRLAFDAIGGVRRRARANPRCPSGVAEATPADTGSWEATWQLQDDQATRRALMLWVPSTTVADVVAHADDPSPEVRETVGRHPLVPRRLLADLAKSPDPCLRAAVAANPRTPTSVLRALTAGPEWFVRWELANNTSTPVDALEHLATSGDVVIQIAVVKSRAFDASTSGTSYCVGTPFAMVKDLDEPFEPMEERLRADICATRVRIVTALARNHSRDFRVQCLLADDGATPAPILVTWAQQSLSPWVRRTIARNGSAPAAALTLLARDLHASVRRVVAENQATPPATLLALVDTSHRDWHTQVALAENLATPPEALARLIHVAVDWVVRYRVARHPSTSTDTLQALAHDEHSSVREAVAARPGLTVKLRGILKKDRDKSVRDTLTKNKGHGVELVTARCGFGLWEPEDEFEDNDDDD